jgi:UDP-glucose 4-epimerase
MPSPETHLIPNLLLYFLGERMILWFMHDFPTPMGPLLEIISRDDLARAHVLALDRWSRRTAVRYSILAQIVVILSWKLLKGQNR